MLEINVKNPVGEVCARVYTQQGETGWTMVWGGLHQGQMTSPTVIACSSREHAEAFARDQARSLEEKMGRPTRTLLQPEILGIVDKARFPSEQTPEGYLIKIPGFGTDKAIESVYWMSLDLRMPPDRLKEIAAQLTQTPPKPSVLPAFQGRVFGYVPQFNAYPTYGPGIFLRPGDSRFRNGGKVKVTVGTSNIHFQDADLPAPQHQLKLLFRHDVFPEFVSTIVQAAANID